MEKLSFRNVLILGLGDIGEALANHLKSSSSECRVFATKRKADEDSHLKVFELDPTKDESWKEFTRKLSKECESLDLVISTYGVLKSSKTIVEKRLSDIEMDSMVESFKVNALSAPIAAKYIEPFFSQDSLSYFVFLSAKLASIDDNKIGGWYSYRASKTALNMFMKNIAIEYQRKKLLTCVLSIHPGTTETKLSKDFLNHTSLKVWSPQETAKHILSVIKSSSLEDSGSFKNWDNNYLKW